MSTQVIYQPIPQRRLRTGNAAIAAEQKKRYEVLLNGLEVAKLDFQAAQKNFDRVCDPKLVDVCIYQIQTAQNQYENLLRQVKLLRQEMAVGE